MKTAVYLYVFDTMADWEPALAVAELNSGRCFKPGVPKFTVRTVGLTLQPVVTMGGLRIVPDLALDACAPDEAALLLLPGGETWQESLHAPVVAKAKECLAAGGYVAAICGATLALAQAGLLNDRLHTSNDLEYLKTVCPDYSGERYFRPEPAVCDRRVITASGLAPLDFARQILENLGVLHPATLAAWYNLFVTRKVEYFQALMESLKEK